MNQRSVDAGSSRRSGGMRRFAAGLVVLMAAPLLAGCRTERVSGPDVSSAAAPGDTASIVVDLGSPRQRIDGFGANTLPLVYPTGDYLGSYRAAAVKAVYGDVGINLGPLAIGVVETPRNASDPWGQRGNDDADPFRINPLGFNFASVDALGEKILQPRAPYGSLAATPGPILDLRGALAWLEGVRRTDYPRYLDEAAENVVALVAHWRDAFGGAPGLLYLFNEPTSGNVELKSTSTHEVVDLVKRVGQRLTAAGFGDVRFVVPNEETVQRSREVAEAILSDPAARPYVGVIGYHPYPYGSPYASPRRILEASGAGSPDPAATREMEALKSLASRYGVPVWMTEVSEGPGNNDYGFSSIENVLARAVHVHDNFQYAGASAYFGMNAIWDSRSHAEHFAGRNVPFLSEQSGIVLADVGSGKIYITGMGYAIGQYARWVRPGSRWVDARSDEVRVISSAFLDAANRRLTVVAVNADTRPQLLQIRVSGGAVRGPVKGEESYQEERWRSIGPLTPAGADLVSYVAPARSVVTLEIPLS